MTAITAAAGYGKTTLLADFVETLPATTAWLTLTPGDCDPVEFLSDLSLALLVDAPLGRRGGERQDLLQLLGQTRDPGPERLVLVLDDCQVVEQSQRTLALLDELLLLAPPSWRLLLASRRPLPLTSLTKLLGEQELLHLEAEQLAFDVEEVQQFLSNRRRGEVSREEARRCWEQTDGWITGLVLLEETSLAGPHLGSPDGGRRLAFEYLMGEVFSRLSEDQQEFLLTTSVLSELEPRTCDQLRGRSNSRPLLESLQRENAFITRIEVRQGAYRCHHLFQDFLRARLQSERPDDFVRLCEKAGELEETEERWSEAVSLYASARVWRALVRVLRRATEPMIARGSSHVLLQWLELLPSELLQENIDLSLLKVRVHVELGQIDEALTLLNRLEAEGDDDCWLRARVYYAICVSRKGRHREAVAACRRALRDLDRTDASRDLRAQVNLHLGISLGESGRFGAALRPLKAALLLWEQAGDRFNASMAADSLGRVCSTLGRLPEAQHYFERAREGWQSLDNDYRLALTLNNLGVLYQWLGENDLSALTLSQALEKSRASQNSRMEAYSLISLADVRRDTGEIAEAIALYGQGLEICRRLGEANLICYAVDGLANCYLRLGDLDKAEVLVQQAEVEATQRGGDYEKGLVGISRGILAGLNQEADDAVAHLRESAAFLEKVGAKRERARALFHLASVLFSQNARTLALESLGMVSALVREIGYSGFLKTEALRCPTLVAYAASRNAGDGLFRALRDSLGDAAEVGWTEASPRPRGSVIYPLIEARGLGPIVVSIDGKEVKGAAWSSAKSKELFFYFLSNQAPITREACLASLWPDLDEARAASNFHASLYRLRRATYFDIVERDGGRYGLNPSARLFFDAAEFERRLEDASSFPRGAAGRIRLLKEAIALYRGPFAAEFYSEWAEAIRARLESKFLAALASLGGYHFAEGHYEEALQLCDRILEADRYNDEAHRLKIEICLAQDDRVSANRHYRRYLKLAQEELLAEPSDLILRLRERIVS